MATESEIPVPSAMYAAKQTGHFGTIAKISAGTENFAKVNPRCVADDGWVFPSAALLAKLRLGLIKVEQQADFICDSHSRSRMTLLSELPQTLPQDNGHDGGPMTS